MTAFNPHNSGETIDTRHDPHDADHGHDHPPHLAHHFDTPEQQFDSAKLGMWVFLATEILMFGGLFCAYAVYRYNHPEVFRYSEHHLNTALGATNTVVLLASSLTMALAVRAAQLGQQTLLKLMLAFTLLGGVGFMAIKTVEYSEKFSHGLFPGRWSVYDKQQNPEGYAKYFAEHQGGDEHLEEEHEQTTLGSEGIELADEGHGGERPQNAVADAANVEHGPEAIGGADDEPHATRQSDEPLSNTIPTEQRPAADHPSEMVDSPRQAPAQNREPPAGERLAYLDPDYIDPHVGTGDAALIRPAFNSPEGLSLERHGGHAIVEYTDLSIRDQANVKTFFSIYFMMTGLHGLHVLIGMGLIGWVYVKAAAGTFGPAYFTPVDVVGLYWHLVDLIWIFLFPLLYLIH